MHNELEVIKAAQWLATTGTSETIIKGYTSIKESYFKDMCTNSEKHRYGTHWLRCDEAYEADRLYRLFINLFGEKALHKVLDIVEFTILCKTYFTKFPTSIMSKNRIHFLILSIRNGDAVVKNKCKSCGLPFVLHRDDCLEDTCHICRQLSKKISGDVGSGE